MNGANGLPAYALSGVRFRHPGAKGPFILAIDALEVPAGGILGLVGPNGAGKTTLLMLLALLRRPEEGTVSVFGADPWRNGDEAARLRREITLVTHHPYLFKGSVGDNVEFGLKVRGRPEAERAARVAEALSQVELEGFEGKPVGALSAGQAQRVALARALAIRPRVLLLDEPTANIDAALAPRIEAVLREVTAAGGTTIVLSTHNFGQASRLAGRILFLSDGHPSEFGHENYFTGRAETDGTLSWIPVRGGRRIVFRGRYEGRVTCVVRPDRIRIEPRGDGGGRGVSAAPETSAAHGRTTPDSSSANVFSGRVTRLETFEPEMAMVRVGGEPSFRVHAPLRDLAAAGISLSTGVLVTFGPDAVQVIKP